MEKYLTKSPFSMYVPHFNTTLSDTLPPEEERRKKKRSRSYEGELKNPPLLFALYDTLVHIMAREWGEKGGRTRKK